MPTLMDWIQAASTVLLCILTAAYVIITNRILSATRPQPNVFVCLPRAGDLRVLLSIQNIGNRPAYDVEIDITPNLDILAPTDHFKGASQPMLRQPFMAPQSEVKGMVTNTLMVLGSKTKVFSINLRYRDAHGRRYFDAYRIDVGSYIYEKHFG